MPARFQFGLLALATLAFHLVACGDGGSSSKSNAVVPDVGESASQLLKAQDGGELTLKDVRLQVPSEALSEDLEISVDVEDSKSVPDRDRVVGPVYNFGPDGTQFNKDAKLELPLPRLPGKKEQARIAWLDEANNKWVPLSASKRSGDRLAAPVKHFTRFTITFDPIADGGSASGVCAAEFDACGGDLDGTWDFSDACIAGEVTPPVDVGPCAGLSTTFNIGISGSVTFSEGSMSGTQVTDLESKVVIPLSCLPSGTSCSDLQASESGDNCEIVQSEPNQTEMIDQTYTVDGSSLVFDDGTEAEYCVRGDTLTVRLLITSDGGPQAQYTATRH